ncbi:MAG: DUF4962 domain-containing protein [Bacteroidales bacterium]
MKHTIILIGLFIFSIYLNAANFRKQDVLPGEIKLEAKAVHPFFRTDAFPVNMEVDVNPVTFYWPSIRQEFTEPLLTYEFQLSKTDNFQQIVEENTDRNPSFYVAKTKLPIGTWYWRYREKGKEWNGPYAFSVGPETQPDERPQTMTFVKNVGGERPRVVIRNQQIEAARRNFKDQGVTETIINETSKYFDVVLPDEEWGGKFYKNGQRVFSQKKFPDDHVKAKITAPIWNGAVTSLCRAYLLTGEEKYAKEALRWGLKVATFPVLPHTITYDGNPFPDGFDFSFYLDVMTYVYDALYNYMSVEQRNIIRDNLSERLSIYYRYYCNRLENRCIDNHTWQISLGSFVRGAIVAKGDIPEADKYLAYAYDIWTARDPEQSHHDGGWFGGGYVGVNIGVWTEVPVYFRNYTGYNFYNHPFYRNHPYWFLYRQVPGSKEDGFSGDGYGDDLVEYSPNVKMWLNILDAELDIPAAGFIAKDLKENRKLATFAWARKVEGLQMSKERKRVELTNDLPQARAFRDVGVVNMHTSLLNPENDLHVAFRSSPYGTFGHNLASHNAFNVIYQGDYLFVPHGHRHGGAKNTVACYRHTRGHNSVLVDGKGQPFSPEAYGWIARFLHGNNISYACGDASNAYDASPFGRENDFFTRAELNIEDHISRGAVERFRRHVLFLRPSLIVVYDELEANRPVRWDWVLHCRQQMTANGTKLTVENKPANVEVFGSVPMKAEVLNEPMFLPINIDGRGSQKAGTPYPVKGSYAYVSTCEKSKRQRIVSFIQVGDVKPVQKKMNGQFECGPWQINCEMDPQKYANIIVSGPDNSSFILKTPDTGESVLKEKIDGTPKIWRAVDELPFCARGLPQTSNIISKNR